ncbi:MAG: DNA cytosine methyltransferase [Clostridia bacterium]|nr:DNA cytosine methyltransferase [Clostridia bacterium]
MRIVDLFSGAGGLTFGFYYKLDNGRFVKKDNAIIFANEFNKNAAAAYKKNYTNVNMIVGDIREVLTDELIREKIGNEEVDLIIGGPPCQSFSTVGKRIYDEKAKLFWEYLRLIRVVRPKMFLFENVKGLLSMKEVFYKKDENGEILKEKKQIGHEGGKQRTIEVPIVDHYGKKIIDIIKKEFGDVDKDLGYDIESQVVDAVNFGVPQNRQRVVILGVRKDLGVKIPKFESGNKTELTIRDAISDLPVVNEGEEIKCYDCKPQNVYQRLMRGDNKVLRDHSCGTYGDKIRTVIQHVKQGQGRNDFNALVDAGKIDKKYYLTSGYKNTYGRLEENKPSTTITNNLSTPSGLRCIHYSQDRALTSREGARIQSFPDWFYFEGKSRAEINTQIGNAVPPLMAMAIARIIEKVLGGGN